MSKNIGIYGGNSVYQLGPYHDAAAFFKCLDRFIPETRSDGAFDVITDRLRRKYIRKDELDSAVNVLDAIRSKLETVANRNVNWLRLGVDEDLTKLNLSGHTIALVFEGFFSAFMKARESAISFFETFKIYQPVRIVFADMPDFMDDIDRPLAEYDQNDSLPFWLR
jgi:hypothetical protein